MLAPGDTIGILGGGQLGRMIALAAAPLGFRVHVLAPEADSPAFDVAARRIVAPYDDEAALAAFAADVAVVTYEFENVPAACAAFLASRVRSSPAPRCSPDAGPAGREGLHPGARHPGADVSRGRRCGRP